MNLAANIKEDNRSKEDGRDRAEPFMKIRKEKRLFSAKGCVKRYRTGTLSTFRIKTRKEIVRVSSQIADVGFQQTPGIDRIRKRRVIIGFKSCQMTILELGCQGSFAQRTAIKTAKFAQEFPQRFPFRNRFDRESHRDRSIVPKLGLDSKQERGGSF